MKRRDFLKTMQSLMILGIAGSIPGLSFLPAPAQAAGRAKKFFLMIRLSPGNGGWDVTLGLDPKTHAQQQSDDSDMFIEYHENEILTASQLRFGPACSALIPHASDIAIVNGIFMSDSNVSHDANSDYMTTGDSMGQFADLAVEIANSTEAGSFGVLFNQNLKRAGRLVMPTTLSNILSIRNSINIGSMQDFLSKVKNKNEFHEAEMSLIKNSEGRYRLVKELQSLSSQINESSPGSDPSGAPQMAAIVGAAFASETSFQAQLDLSTYLDTHSAHAGTHMKNQKSCWDAIATIFQTFKNIPYVDSSGAELGSLFDFTTFMVTSDFSRTPALNAAQGKDHNPLTNSVLLAGHGVNGGQSMGISKLILRKNSLSGESRHVGVPIDYETGEAAPTLEAARDSRFQFIYPENVISTVADIMAIDRAKFANVPPQTASLKGLIKNNT